MSVYEHISKHNNNRVHKATLLLEFSCCLKLSNKHMIYMFLLQQKTSMIEERKIFHIV